MRFAATYSLFVTADSFEVIDTDGSNCWSDRNKRKYGVYLRERKYVSVKMFLLWLRQRPPVPTIPHLHPGNMDSVSTSLVRHRISRKHKPSLPSICGSRITATFPIYQYLINSTIQPIQSLPRISILTLALQLACCTDPFLKQRSVRCQTMNRGTRLKEGLRPPVSRWLGGQATVKFQRLLPLLLAGTHTQSVPVSQLLHRLLHLSLICL